MIDDVKWQMSKFKNFFLFTFNIFDLQFAIKYFFYDFSV